MFSKLLTLASAVTSVAATAAPSYAGWNLAWQETFSGAAGTSPNTNNWNIIQSSSNANGEWETYTNSNQNVQLSGGDTLQLVPQNNNGAWTSGRIESKYVFTPQYAGQSLMEAQIRMGDIPQANKQGIWPAFWMLGDSIRHGTPWPQCGEIDILEQVDGILTGYGTIHCDVYPGGLCNESNGIGGSVSIPDNGWHTWRVIIDNATGSWTTDSINWYRDGVQYFQVTGARVGSQAVWNTLVNSPLYFILNVAVGGNWPGAPNGATTSGWGNYMEVAYVAQYNRA
ncbi:putative endo-1,3(4)-beta-glucanase [Xylariaceae sp. FL1272]|nr:putative endo-1,3(4)-beta-glucanase [Xylariaceae sp. FL1272]